MTALLFATSRGHIDIVDYLLQNGADSSAKTDNNRGAVLMAVLSGQIEMFKYFTENGFSLDEKDQEGNSLLHMALFGRNPEMLKYLLEAGVNVNIPNNPGATPLMNSVFRGDPALTEMLLKAGAQPDITDNRGVSALLESVRSGKPALLQLMLQYSGSVEITDSLTGMNVLHIAAVRGQSDAVKTQNHLLIFDYWETENKPDEIFLRSGYITPEEIKDLNVLVFYPMNTRITLSRKYFSGEITFRKSIIFWDINRSNFPDMNLWVREHRRQTMTSISGQFIQIIPVLGFW